MKSPMSSEIFWPRNFASPSEYGSRKVEPDAESTKSEKKKGFGISPIFTR